MKKSKKLTYEERIQIRTHLENYVNPSQISKRLGRARSTISRELNKWGYRDDEFCFEDYDPSLAHFFSRDAYGVVHRDESKLEKHPKLLRKVKKFLKKRWSPEQVSDHLKRWYPNDKNMNISHESIYKFIYFIAKGELKDKLISYLRRSKKKRKSSIGSRKHKSKIIGRVSIEDRPTEVEDRIVPGHWESDLIIGKDKKTAIGTIVERTSRFVIIVPLKNRTAKEIKRAFKNALMKLPKELTKTLTHDNGMEMAHHAAFSKDTKIPVYFCHPYSSWERGTNENTNGLIRDFWPKGYDFNQLNYYRIKKVQKLLNERPRKILNGKSPKEILEDFIKNVA